MNWQVDSDSSRIRTRILAEEGHLQIVVHLEALVGVGTFTKVGDRLCSGCEIELLDGTLHQTDTPAEKAIAVINMDIIFMQNRVTWLNESRSLLFFHL
jgi:hypothetical protein